MKIVFFSDAHGNQYTVKNLFLELEVLKPDLIVFGGDIFGYYYGQKEIIKILRESSCICLLGNHDRYFLDLVEGKRDETKLIEKYGMTYKDVVSGFSKDDIKFLYSLQSKYEMNIDDLRLVFVHGSLSDPLNGRVYPDTVILDEEMYKDFDYVFMGHTHHKLVRTLSNGTVLLNPGSIGQQRDGKGCTFGLFDTEDKSWIINKVEFNKELLLNEIMEHNEEFKMQERLVEVLFRDKNNRETIR